MPSMTTRTRFAIILITAPVLAFALVDMLAGMPRSADYFNYAASGFRGGGFAVPAGLTRADYRASWAKMVELLGLMHKAGVPIVASGAPSERPGAGRSSASPAAELGQTDTGTPLNEDEIGR